MSINSEKSKDNNTLVKDKNILINSILTALNKKVAVNIELKNKCNKILSKYLKTIEQVEIYKRRYEELERQYSSNPIKFQQLEQECDSLKKQYEELQKNHYAYVNSSELKYQKACLQIDELEKENTAQLKHVEKLKSPKKPIKQTISENEFMQVQKMLEDITKKYEKLKEARNEELKHITALKLECINLRKNKQKGEDNDEIHKNSKKSSKALIGQLKTRLNKKTKELEFVTLAHENDITFLKKTHEVDIQQLKAKITSEKCVQLISSCTQTECDENSEINDINEILKEMIEVPSLMTPLSSFDSVNNDTEDMLKHSIAVGPDTLIELKDVGTMACEDDVNGLNNNIGSRQVKSKLKLVNRIKKSYNGKTTKKQYRKLQTLLNLSKESFKSDNPFIVLPPYSKIKSLKDFLGSDTGFEENTYGRYSHYQNYNPFSNPYSPFNPYYSPYNMPLPFSNMYYPPNHNYCPSCSKIVPCCSIHSKGNDAQSYVAQYCCKNTCLAMNNLNVNTTNIEADNEDKNILFPNLKEKKHHSIRKNSNSVQTARHGNKNIDEESCASSCSNNSKASIYTIKNFMKHKPLNFNSEKEQNNYNEHFVSWNKIYLTDNYLNRSKSMSQESVNKKRKSRIIVDTTDEEDNRNDVITELNSSVGLENELNSEQGDDNKRNSEKTSSSSNFSIVSLSSEELPNDIFNCDNTKIINTNEELNIAKNLQFININKHDRLINEVHRKRRNSLESLSSTRKSKIRTYSESSLSELNIIKHGKTCPDVEPKITRAISGEKINAEKNKEIVDTRSNTIQTRQTDIKSSNSRTTFIARNKRIQRKQKRVNKSQKLQNTNNDEQMSEESDVFNEIKWNTLGFKEEEINNDCDKIYILNKLIKQHEKYLLCAQNGIEVSKKSLKTNKITSMTENIFDENTLGFWKEETNNNSNQHEVVIAHDEIKEYKTSAHNIEKVTDKPHIFDENMLGFRKEEMDNNSNQREVVILHEIITKHEKSLNFLSNNFNDANEIIFNKFTENESRFMDMSTENEETTHVINKSTENVETHVINKNLTNTKNQQFVHNAFNTFCEKKRKQKLPNTISNKKIKIDKKNTIREVKILPHTNCSENKVEKLVNCDIVTFYKQKRRVAHVQKSTSADFTLSLNKTYENPQLKIQNKNVILTNQNHEQDIVQMVSYNDSVNKSVPKNDNIVEIETLKKFKRPERSKIKIIRQTPMSPDVIEYVTEKPKIIPLAKKSMNLDELILRVEKLIMNDVENSEEFSEEVKILSQQDALVLSRVIVNIASEDISQAYDKTYTPPAPLLNRTQQRVVLFLHKLSNAATNSNLSELVLQSIEQRLIRERRISYMVSLTRLYVSIVMLYYNAEKLRIMCVNAAYILDQLFPPFMFVILTMYPEVLPTNAQLQAKTAIEACIPRILVQVIKQKTCKKPGYNLLNLNMLLQQYFGYDFERCDENKLIEELMKLFVDSSSKIVYTAIILFCINMPNEWVNKQIVNYLIPLVNKNIQNPMYAELVCTSLQLITKLVQPFFYQAVDKQKLQTIQQWLQGFFEINNTLPLAIRNAVSTSNMLLSKRPFYQNPLKKFTTKQKKKKTKHRKKKIKTIKKESDMTSVKT